MFDLKTNRTHSETCDHAILVSHGVTVVDTRTDAAGISVVGKYGEANFEIDKFCRLGAAVALP